MTETGARLSSTTHCWPARRRWWPGSRSCVVPERVPDAERDELHLEFAWLIITELDADPSWEAHVEAMSP